MRRRDYAAFATVLCVSAHTAAQPGPPPTLPPVPVPAENPITETKRVLGKILFWDAQLSSDNTIACGTCHRAASAGADPRLDIHPGADGIFGTVDDVTGSGGVIRSDAGNAYTPDLLFGLVPQVTPRSAQPALMAMYAPNLFWDGRASGTFTDPQTGAISIATNGALESQAVGPVTSDVEMAHQERDWNQVTAKLATARPLALTTDRPADVAAVLESGPTYPDLFAAAFGDGAITSERVAFAIATYERTLLPNQTPWDLFVQGQNTALTPQQQQGLNTFQAPGSRCGACHTPPFFTNHTFRNIGLRPWAEDPGRQEVTNLFQDRGRFKVPTLRNVGLKQTFMHNGRLSTLGEVLDFYLEVNGQVQFPQNQDPLVPAIAIPPQARANLIAFLADGLTDPRVENETFPFDRPTLHTELPSANPALIGAGTAGSGGLEPVMIAASPPLIGDAGFRIGIDRALGGAEAFAVVSQDPPGLDGRLIGGVTSDAITLAGTGPGAGHGTFAYPLADDVAQRGLDLYMQWFVSDPAAPGAIAATPVAHLELFYADPTECDCEQDFDCDRQVGFADLNALLTRWGPCPSCEPDLTGNDSVGFADLQDLLAAWGACGT